MIKHLHYKYFRKKHYQTYSDITITKETPGMKEGKED